MADLKSPFLVLTTGGVIEDDDTLFLHQSTFRHVANTIADEIDDEHGEYRKQIQDSIYAAIRYCERETFYFNENRDECFSTVEGQRIYTKADNKHIGSAVQISRLYLVRDHSVQEMMRLSHPQMELRLRDPSINEPRYFSYYNKQLYLDPKPNGVYNMRMLLTPLRFGDLDSLDDTHPWFEDGFDLIKARAKYELYKNVLREPDLAAASYNDFQEHLQSLRYETSKRKGCNRIHSSEF